MIRAIDSPLTLDEQQEACAHSPAPTVWCVASPGAGKTATLTEAIAHRIEKGAHWSEILAVTFTRLARAEMQRRLAARIEDGRRVWVGTFHSVCYSLIQIHWKRLGYASDRIAIYDQHDQRQLLKETVTNSRHSVSMKAVTSLLSLYDEEELAPGTNAPVHSVAANYLAALRQHQAVDYSLIPRLALRLIRSGVPIPWKHVFVDEAHDVSLQEIEFIRLLNPQRLFLVSDLKQSIYGFRGSRPDLLPTFLMNRTGLDTHVLNKNYRSGKCVVAAGNRLIPILVRPSDIPVEAHLMESVSPDDGGSAVVVNSDLLIEAIEAHAALGTVGVLARTHSILVGLSNAMEDRGIEHTLVGRFDRILDQPGIRDLLAYLAWPAWPENLSYMKRVLAAERVADLTAAQIHAESRKSGRPVLDVAVDRLAGLREFYRDDLPLDEMPLSEQVALTFGRLRSLNGGVEAQTQREFMELVSLFIRKEKWDDRTAANFITWLALRDPQDDVDVDGGIQLMTIHASKGLEFDTVVLAGARDDVLPDRRSQEGEALQEERRLFFVAITRARQWLIFELCQNRSRFISEICI